MSELTPCTMTPSCPRRTLPWSTSCAMTLLAILAGIAKPMPMLPPEGDRICELMPTSSPLVLTSAPPELPWLIGASVWRKSSKLPSPRPVARPLALTMPMVTVWPTPSGLPKASTTSPTRDFPESPSGRAREALRVDPDHGEVARGVRAHERRR